MLEQIIRELEGLLPSLEADLGQVQNSRELEEVRLAYLGKKGRLTAILKSFGGLSPEERPLAGKAANEVKDRTADLFEKCSAVLRESEIGALLSNETVDITMPGTAGLPGRRHPVAHVLHEIEDIFTSMGFDIEVGPDIEDDYHNFEALNIPFNHPARDMHDTFYIKGGLLLRTHTSPVQIRTMKRKKPPVAFIAPGKVYRVDQDVSHSPMFIQVEGLMVDRGISFGNLKGVLEVFIHRFFGENVRVRFRPSFFPFTEPSAEVDIACVLCKGAGCRVCKQSGWLEIMGCGMVHPAVLENVGYNSEDFSGFAFGMGVDRITMLRYGINDIRLLYENDLRFLRQF